MPPGNEVDWPKENVPVTNKSLSYAALTLVFSIGNDLVEDETSSVPVTPSPVARIFVNEQFVEVGNLIALLLSLYTCL